ncbi:MAG: hypothetical protein L3J28_01045 [Candidatus Polarisedimenticolaceae bacterium]|nr:hypothetical protein [Candidatus Polarisedimenticolaceae bacterium]
MDDKKMTMNSNQLLLKMVFFIGVITIFSGLGQMIKPDLVLSIISDSEQSAGGNHSFAIIGMFMVLFGGLVVHALSTESQSPTAILWCTFQKLGAAFAVAIGVSNGLFSSLALAVAGFDLLSFFVMFAFWLTIKNNHLSVYHHVTQPTVQ